MIKPIYERIETFNGVFTPVIVAALSRGEVRRVHVELLEVSGMIGPANKQVWDVVCLGALHDSRDAVSYTRLNNAPATSNAPNFDCKGPIFSASSWEQGVTNRLYKIIVFDPESKFAEEHAELCLKVVDDVN